MTLQALRTIRWHKHHGTVLLGHDRTCGLETLERKARPCVKVVIHKLLNHVSQRNGGKFPAILDSGQHHDLAEHVKVSRLNGMPAAIQLNSATPLQGLCQLSWPCLSSKEDR